MKNQLVRSAALALCLSALAGCASAPKTDGATVHAAAPAAPVSFTRVDMMRDYVFSESAMVAVSAGADASFAAAHESDTGLNADHARESALNGVFAQANIMLPAGWTQLTPDKIRHDASGLECPAEITLADENRIFSLRQIKTFDQKNLDVACDYASARGSYITFYASFWPLMSVEESYSGAVAAIQQRFQVSASTPVPVATMTSEDDDPLFDGLEPQLAGGFEIGSLEGVPYKTALWLTKTHGWHVKARATYPSEDATSEIMTAIMFSFAHLNVRAKNMKDPVTEGGEV